MKYCAVKSKFMFYQRSGLFIQHSNKRTNQTLEGDNVSVKKDSSHDSSQVFAVVMQACISPFVFMFVYCLAVFYIKKDNKQTYSVQWPQCYCIRQSK